MKTTIVLLFTGFLLSAFLDSQNKKVIFFGDSITEAGVKPGGYITVLTEIASKSNPGKFAFTGAGIGGNKVYDLYLRMEKDVMAQHPDVVVVYIGVNDVWHKQTHGTGTDPDKFEKFYQAIIDRLNEKKIKILLCTPAAIGERTDYSNPLDGDLNRYSNIIRGLASKNNLTLVDLRKTFLDYNLKNNSQNQEAGILTSDRVHLNSTGNRLVAEIIWEKIKDL